MKQARTVLCASEEETRAFGRALASELSPGRTLFLYGEMGAGKTVLAKGIAEGLGIDPEEIRSPTFTLIHEHCGVATDLAHLDLYRLSEHEIEALAIDEVLARPGVKVVEWSERLGAAAELDPTAIRLQIVDAGGRRRRIERLASASADGASSDGELSASPRLDRR